MYSRVAIISAKVISKGHIGLALLQDQISPFCDYQDIPNYPLILLTGKSHLNQTASTQPYLGLSGLHMLFSHVVYHFKNLLKVP